MKVIWTDLFEKRDVVAVVDVVVVVVLAVVVVAIKSV